MKNREIWTLSFLSHRSILKQKSVQLNYQRIFFLNLFFQISHFVVKIGQLSKDFSFKKDQDFPWISSRLGKNHPNFVSQHLKLHNQYCHTPKPSKYVKRVLCLLSNDNGRYLPHAGKRSYKKVYGLAPTHTALFLQISFMGKYLKNISNKSMLQKTKKVGLEKFLD